MPRKVTKTMKEARARAAAQKRERNKFKQSYFALNYSFGSNIHDERRPFRQAGTVTARTRIEQPNLPEVLSVGDTLPVDSVQTDADFTSIERRVLSDEEYARREQAAQQEIERKKSCIAPAYNKGAYQYIASKDQAKDVGKK